MRNHLGTQRRFRIDVEGNFERAVTADNADDAFGRWLDEESYNDIAHAAEEYGCSPADFLARDSG